LTSITVSMAFRASSEPTQATRIVASDNAAFSKGATARYSLNATLTALSNLCCASASLSSLIFVSLQITTHLKLTRVQTVDDILKLHRSLTDRDAIGIRQK